MEIWKQIDGFEGRYEISSSGIVRNRKTGKTLKHTFLNGYPAVRLSWHNEDFFHLVHRLVAQYFIPNPNNYPVVNHKDENPANCNVDNLEWCTMQYNSNYGTSRECHKVPVLQLTMDGKVVNTFKSLSEASEKTGIRLTGISDTINKRHKSAGGYKWEYIDRKSGWKKAGTYSKEILGIKPLYIQQENNGCAHSEMEVATVTVPKEKIVLRNIKLTEDENQQLKRDAYAHGMNVSEYIRWLVEKERKEHNDNAV